MTQADKLQGVNVLEYTDQLLKQAMEAGDKFQALLLQAVKNGYKGSEKSAVSSAIRLPIVYTKDGEQKVDTLSLIFNHDFAKALFGEETIMFGNIRGEFSNDFDRGRWFTHKDVKEMHAIEYNWGISLPLFQYHLQQAVIAEDPISYMYEVVFNG